MNRSGTVMCAALLALALAQGACSTAAGSGSDLIPDNYAETGMLNPVEVVAERPGSVLDEVVVIAPAVRLQFEGTTVRLVLPGPIEIEVSDFSPSVDPLN